MPKLIVGLSLFLGLLWGGISNSYAQDHLIVGENGQYATITAALEVAITGDTIEVRGGIYPAPLVIDKSVTLLGVDSPVIDGGGVGNLVVITAPQVTFQGFTLRNTGSNMSAEDTAIIVEGEHVSLLHNRMENVLYGIYFSDASYGLAQGNQIYGQALDETLRGDGIRVWYSKGIQLLENEIYTSRDVLISYADDLIIRGNIISQNRYGLHFMYSDDVQVIDNHFEENSVGAFLMYSKNITLTNNTFAYNHGIGGYGLALKDMDYVHATDNLIIGNSIGLYLDNSPSIYDAENTFEGNWFAYNEEGVVTLPSVERNHFQANTLLDNTQQVAIHGRGNTSRNIWRGNYWSDYAGYDRDGDQHGDLTYQADKLFEHLADTYPVLKLFHYSPVAQAIELGGSAFPILRPYPIVQDESPLMAYIIPPQAQPLNHQFSPSFAGLVLSLLGLTGVILGLVMHPLPIVKKIPPPPISQKEGQMITVTGVHKMYRHFTALDNLTFTVGAGESLALWGDNGAGKTTTLMCLLGVYPFEGQIMVNDISVQSASKQARRVIGYIPQEVRFYDMSVRENVRFYADLKQVSPTEIQGALEQVGLAEHQHKFIRSLSGGMKQRLALAIGLLGDPPILLFDEPTANLDVQARHEFLELVKKLNLAGKTIVFTTHRLEEVVALAQRVLVLKAGRIEHDCTPTELPEKLGLQKWLRIQVPSSLREDAITLLQNQGYQPRLNTTAFYVHIPPEGKMRPLRLLAEANIPVDDFDVVENRVEMDHD